MMQNPEFRRLLWLEFSSHRIVALPVVFGLVLMAVGMVPDSDPHALAVTSLLVFGALVLIWGYQLVSLSMSRELEHQTWDTQRMTPLSPWSMTLGKLLGGAAYAWYGGLIALVAYLLIPDRSFGERLQSAVLLVVVGIAFHGTSLLATLHSLYRRLTGGRSSSMLLIAVFAVMTLSPFWRVISVGDFSVEWYGSARPGFYFVLASWGMIAAWSVVGAYRLMRRELQVRSGPWVWMAFVVWLILYLAGFPHLNRTEQSALLGLVVSLGLTYAFLLGEPKDMLSLRRMWNELLEGSWLRASHRVPTWAATLPILAVCGVATIATAPDAETALFAVSLLLFAGRDLCLVLGFNATPNPKRADAAALLYLLVLYGLVPLLLGGASDSGAAELFYPDLEGRAAHTVVALVQFGVAAGWLRWRWRALSSGGGASPSR